MRTGGGHHRAEKEGGTVWLQETGRCLERERSSPHSPAAAAAAAEPLMFVRSPNEEARSCGAQRQAAARSLHHPFPGGRGSERGREGDRAARRLSITPQLRGEANGAPGVPTTSASPAPVPPGPGREDAPSCAAVRLLAAARFVDFPPSQRCARSSANKP